MKSNIDQEFSAQMLVYVGVPRWFHGRPAAMCVVKDYWSTLLGVIHLNYGLNMEIMGSTWSHISTFCYILWGKRPAYGCILSIIIQTHLVSFFAGLFFLCFFSWLKGTEIYWIKKTKEGTGDLCADLCMNTSPCHQCIQTKKRVINDKR